MTRRYVRRRRYSTSQVLMAIVFAVVFTYYFHADIAFYWTWFDTAILQPYGPMIILGFTGFIGLWALWMAKGDWLKKHGLDITGWALFWSAVSLGWGFLLFYPPSGVFWAFYFWFWAYVNILVMTTVRLRACQI